MRRAGILSPRDATQAMSQDLLVVENLRIHLKLRRTLLGGSAEVIRAVDGVSLHLGAGETLGLVGESGSGKTTLARAILRRVPVTSGRILFDGQDLTELSGSTLRRIRSEFQMVFQDPYSSLNPRMKVRDIVAEPLRVHKKGISPQAVDSRVNELLTMVHLPREAADRYPHAFSGGQRQRLGIARALALDPRLVVMDEPVSALDVSIQAQILQLIHDIQQQLNTAFIIIAHDLAAVRAVSHRIAVMYCGRLVEVGAADDVCTSPRHPYTQALLSAVPIPDPVAEAKRERIVLKGELPNPVRPPAGCRFHTRCPYAMDECRGLLPELVLVAPAHESACIRTKDIFGATTTAAAAG